MRLALIAVSAGVILPRLRASTSRRPKSRPSRFQTIFTCSWAVRLQGNILVSVGSDGLFLVDTMYGQMHQKIMDALSKISPQPIRYLVNTHLHGDHTAGNEAMAKLLGAVIIFCRTTCASGWPGSHAAALPAS